jgi:hypothetical protein
MNSKKGIIYSIAVLAFSLVIVGLAQFAIEQHDASKSDFVEIENIVAAGYAFDDVSDDLRYLTGADIALERNSTTLIIHYYDKTPFLPVGSPLVNETTYATYLSGDYFTLSRSNLSLNASSLNGTSAPVIYLAYDLGGVNDTNTSIYHQIGSEVDIAQINISNRFKPYRMDFVIRCNLSGVILNSTSNDTTVGPSLLAYVDYQDPIFKINQLFNFNLTNGTGTSDTNKSITINFLPYGNNYFQIAFNGSEFSHTPEQGEPYKVKFVSLRNSNCAWNASVFVNTTDYPAEFFAYYNAWANFTHGNLSKIGMVPIGRA